MGHVHLSLFYNHLKYLPYKGDGPSGAQTGVPCNLTEVFAADSFVGEVNDLVMPCVKQETVITSDQRNTLLSRTFQQQQARN